MDGQLAKTCMEVPRRDVPEDLAVLYAWAQLQAARYCDLSAAGRDGSAGARQGAPQFHCEARARFRLQAEATAVQAEEGARVAEKLARFHEAQALKAMGEERVREAELQQAARERALRTARALGQRAAQARQEVSRLAVALRDADARPAPLSTSTLQQGQTFFLPKKRPGPPETTSGGAMPGEDALTDPQPRLRVVAAARGDSSANEEGDDMRPERFPRRQERGRMALLPAAGRGGAPFSAAATLAGIEAGPGDLRESTQVPEGIVAPHPAPPRALEGWFEEPSPGVRSDAAGEHRVNGPVIEFGGPPSAMRRERRSKATPSPVHSLRSLRREEESGSILPAWIEEQPAAWGEEQRAASGEEQPAAGESVCRLYRTEIP